VASQYAWIRPYDGLECSLITYEVEEADGPAAKAGLCIGDVILELDGIPIQEVHPLYENKQAGDRVLFTLLREGEPQTLELTLERPPTRILALRLQPVIVALGLWLFSTILFALKPASNEVRLFFFFSQLGIMVLAAGEVSTFLVDWASRLFNLSFCFLSPLTIHLHLVFPRFKAFPCRRIILGLLYGLGLALSLPFVLLDPLLATSPWHPLLYSFIRLYFAFSILVAVVSLVHTYITAPLERRRIRLVALGTAFAFFPLILFSILPDILLDTPILPYELSFPFLILIPLSYAYAISKYKLVQIDLILNRGVVYFVIGVIWAGLYLASVMALDYLLPSTVISRPLLGALITLIMAALFAPLKERIQALVDRAFYGGWYDYRSVIGQLSRSLSQMLDASQLVRLLVEQVSATMRLKGAALLLSNEEGDLVVRGSVGFDDQITATPVKNNGALARTLREMTGPAELPQLHRALAGSELSDEERALLGCDEVQLWLPLVFKGNLRGLILLGAKSTEDFFDAEDRRILGTLAQQAGLAAENVLLVEELRRKLDEITAVKTELEEAHQRLTMGREEERKRLAREIHDIPVQKLIETIYAVKRCQRGAEGSPLEELQKLQEEMLHLLKELRRICQELRPPTLDVFGLASAIRSHTEDFTTQVPLIVKLDLMDDKKQLPDEVAINLFRVYQEALANVEKHAGAERVEVKLTLSPDEVMLAIKDDGCGFVVPRRLGQFVQQDCFGLMGMKERMEMVGGTLQVTSQSGQGTEIRAQVPLRGAHGSH
jgi:signal transduction histidine kinase